jgi:hypothetical protein
MRNHVAPLTVASLVMAANTRVSRTRSCFVFFTACLASAVGVLVGGAQVALASSCANPGFAEYIEDATPAVGQSVNAHIEMASDHVYPGDNVRARLTVVTGPPSAYDFLHVGIRDFGSGPQLYMEHNGTFHGAWNVSYGVAYHVWISHDSTNVYTTHWSSVPSWSQTMSASAGSNRTEFMGIANNISGNCNAFDAYFTSLTPWNVDSMRQLKYAPYSIHTISSTAFETDGP